MEFRRAVWYWELLPVTFSCYCATHGAMWRMAHYTTRGYILCKETQSPGIINELSKERLLHSLIRISTRLKCERSDCSVVSVSVRAIRSDTDEPASQTDRIQWGRRKELRDKVTWLPRVALATNSGEDTQNWLETCWEVTGVSQLYSMQPVCSECIHTMHLHTPGKCALCNQRRCYRSLDNRAPLPALLHQPTTPTTSRLGIPPHYLRACRPFQLRSVHKYNYIFAIATP